MTVRVQDRLIDNQTKADATGRLADTPTVTLWLIRLRYYNIDIVIRWQPHGPAKGELAGLR